MFKQGHTKTFRPAAPCCTAGSRPHAPLPRCAPSRGRASQGRAPQGRTPRGPAPQVHGHRARGTSFLRRPCRARRLPAQHRCQPPIRALAPRRTYELPPPPPWPQPAALPPDPSHPPAPVEATAANPRPDRPHCPTAVPSTSPGAC
jgi:hypothetical protein